MTETKGGQRLTSVEFDDFRKHDFREVRDDLKEIKSDLKDMRADLKAIRTDILEISRDIKELNVKVEQLTGSMKFDQTMITILALVWVGTYFIFK